MLLSHTFVHSWAIYHLFIYLQFIIIWALPVLSLKGNPPIGFMFQNILRKHCVGYCCVVKPNHSLRISDLKFDMWSIMMLLKIIKIESLWIINIIDYWKDVIAETWSPVCDYKPLEDLVTGKSHKHLTWITKNKDIHFFITQTTSVTILFVICKIL